MKTQRLVLLVLTLTAMILTAFTSERYARALDVLDAPLSNRALDNAPHVSPETSSPNAIGDGTVSPSPAPQASPRHCAGLQIGLVIDQSGSMCGTRCNPDLTAWGEGTDPHDLRFHVAQYILRWLYNLYTLTAGDQPLDFAMSILGFGSATHPLLYWTPMSSLSENEFVQRLADIDPDVLGAHSLGWTDIYSALEEERRLFEAAPPPPPGQQYLRAIVLVTDGAPCVSGSSCNQDYIVVPELERIRDFVRNYLPGYEFFVIILDQNDKVYSRWRPQWEEIVCANHPSGCNPADYYIRVNAPAEIGPTFNRILAGLTTCATASASSLPIATMGNGEWRVNVPPYQQQLTLTLFKAEPLPLPGLEILDPQGQPVTHYAEDGTDQPIHVIHVEIPSPGDWTIKVGAGQVFAVYATADAIAAEGKLTISPHPPQTDLVQHLPADLEFSLINTANQQPLDVYPDNAYPVTVTVKAYAASPVPNEPRTLLDTFELTLPPGSQKHSYSQTVPLEFSGTVEFNVSASYLDDSGQPQYLFQDRSLAVADVQPAYVDWHGLEPNSQRQGGKVTLQANVLRKGTDTPVGDLADFAFRVQVTDLNGNPVSFSDASDHAVPDGVLRNDLSGGPGSVKQNIVFDQPGQYNIQAELGWVDPTTQAFVPIDSYTYLTPLEIRPNQPLQLLATRPSEPSSVVQQFPKFWDSTSVLVQFELRDANGNLVSLADVTNGAETKPTISRIHGQEREDVTDRFQEVLPGTYVATFNDMGQGTYRFEAHANTPTEQLAGDFVWQDDTAFLTHKRTFNPLLLYSGIAIGILAVVLAVGSAMTWAAYQKRRKNPLLGELVIVVRDDQGNESTLASIPLARYRRNRKTFKNLGEVNKIVVSTQSDAEVSKSKAFYIEKLYINGAPANRITSNRMCNYSEEVLAHEEATADGVHLTYWVGNGNVTIGSGDNAVF